MVHIPFEFPARPLDAPRLDPPFDQRIASWAFNNHLQITLRTSLGKYPGSDHWHLKRPGIAGTLELTLLKDEHRGWFSVKRGRACHWTESDVHMLVSSLLSAAVLVYFE